MHIGCTSLRIRTLVAALALVLGTACSQVPLRVGSRSGVAHAGVDKTQAGKSWVQSLGEADDQEVLAVFEPSLLGTDQVRVSTLYEAASGRQCRRLLDIHDRILQRLICRNAVGNWQLTRSLETASAMQPYPEDIATVLVPAAFKATAVVAETIAPVHTDSTQTLIKTGRTWVALKQDETLWTLARRVTGDAENWRRIAELNKLPDPSSVVPGQLIEVPASLLGPQGQE